MTSDRRGRVRSRSIEAALWVAVILAGGYVLMPAAVELIQTREAEEREQARAEGAEEDLRESNNLLKWASDDPLVAEKLPEQRLVDSRRVDD